MEEEVNYFGLTVYTRWNHNEPLVGQTTLFESGAQFNPTQGFRAFKKAKTGDQVIFYQVQTDTGLLGIEKLLVFKQVLKIKLELNLNLMNY